MTDLAATTSTRPMSGPISLWLKIAYSWNTRWIKACIIDQFMQWESCSYRANCRVVKLFLLHCRPLCPCQCHHRWVVVAVRDAGGIWLPKGGSVTSTARFSGKTFESTQFLTKTMKRAAAFLVLSGRRNQNKHSKLSHKDYFVQF